jgi:hypothetical protein
MDGLMKGLLEELNFLNDLAITEVATFRMSESGCNLGPMLWTCNVWGLGCGLKTTE